MTVDFRVGRLGGIISLGKPPNQSVLKEINPEYSLEGLTSAETEAPILWSPDVKRRLIGKDPDDEKD